MTELEDQAEAFEPAAELSITDVDTLKVISDALRGRILDRLRAEPMTVKQLASALDRSPKKLYYHVNLMERHGLIRVVRTRLVSGIQEKTYRASAYMFMFEDQVFATTPNQSHLPPGVGLLFDTTKNELDQNIEDGQVILDDQRSLQRLLMRWSLRCMQAEQAAIFYERLEALLDEFMSAEAETVVDQAQMYRLFLTLFPVRRYDRRTTEV